MPNRVGLHRLIQQNTYLSDSHMGRRITGHFYAQPQLPHGKKRIWNCRRNGGQSTTRQTVTACSLKPQAKPELAAHSHQNVVQSPSAEGSILSGGTSLRAALAWVRDAGRGETGTGAGVGAADLDADAEDGRPSP